MRKATSSGEKCENCQGWLQNLRSSIFSSNFYDIGFGYLSESILLIFAPANILSFFDAKEISAVL